MDFQSLSRKELQILCKKNKIPANITNVAMADALAALTNVEGIDLLQSPQTCKAGSRTKPIKDPPPAQTLQLESNPENKNGSDLLDTPALRTDRKRSTRAASVSKTSQLQPPEENDFNPQMLKTPATRRKPTTEPKDKSVVTRPYSTRRSARLLQDPQLSEINKGRQRTAPSVSDDKSTIQDDKDTTSTFVTHSKAPTADAEVATQDSTEILKSNLDKSNKLEGDTNSETKICLESIQVANKAEDVPDAEPSPDLEGIQVANKVEDVPDAEPSLDLEDIQVADKAEDVPDAEPSLHLKSIQVTNKVKDVPDAAETSPDLGSIQVANKVEDVPDAEPSPDLEGIQVANKAEDVPDAEPSLNLEDIQVADKAEDVPDAKPSPDLESIQVANKAEDVPDAKPSPKVLISVEDLAADSLSIKDSKFDQDGSHSELSSFVEVLGGETALGLDHATPEKTTCSEGEEFVANVEVVISPNTCINVAESVLSPVDDASSGLPPVGASSEDSKSNQDSSQTDLQLEHPTPEKIEHSDGQQFVTSGDNIAISGGTPNNDAYQVTSPTDDFLSDEVNEIKLCADGASNANVNPVDGVNPSDDASGANVVQVLIPEDTSRSVEPGLAHSTLEKANNSKGEEFIASGDNVVLNGAISADNSKGEEFDASEDLDAHLLDGPTSANVNPVGVANEGIGLLSDASGVNATSTDVNRVLCATGNIDAGADTDQVMEQTKELEGEHVQSVRSKPENGSPLEESKDLKFHLTRNFELSVADPLESEIPGICKADFLIKGTEVENEKPDNRSRHSEAKGFNPMVDVKHVVGGTAVDIPFSAVTNSNLTQVPGSPQVTSSSSKNVLNQNKKASPVSKMSLRVFDEDKEENRSGGLSARNNKSRLNVMSVAEDKAILGSKLLLDVNKENTTTSASGGMGGKGRQNVVVTEVKRESKEEKGMNNISLRKLKKMFKESLVSNKEQMQFEKTRPALQTLTDNCLVEDGNN